MYLRWFFVFSHPNSVVQFADPNTQLSRFEISNVDSASEELKGTSILKPETLTPPKSKQDSLERPSTKHGYEPFDCTLQAAHSKPTGPAGRRLAPSSITIRRTTCRQV